MNMKRLMFMGLLAVSFALAQQPAPQPAAPAEQPQAAPAVAATPEAQAPEVVAGLLQLVEVSVYSEITAVFEDAVKVFLIVGQRKTAIGQDIPNAQRDAGLNGWQGEGQINF